MPKSMHRPQNSIFPVTYIYYIYWRYLRKLEFWNKNPYCVRFKLFSALVRRYHEKIVDRMIYEQYMYTIPYRLGEMFIAKLKPKLIFDEQGNIDYDKTKIRTDIQSSRKYNKKFLFYNNHTKGYFMKFHWRKLGGAARVKNIGIYEFKPMNPNKKKLSSAINELYTKGKIDFYELKMRC